MCRIMRVLFALVFCSLGIAVPSIRAYWFQDGVALCTAAGTQHYPTIASDGAGGAIVTWYDNRSGNYDIYAHRVNAAGTAEWTANGSALCAATGDQTVPTIISDDAGGAIVAWQDYRSGSSPDTYAQRVNALGIAQWTANGVPLCTASGNQEYPRMASDGAGGAIIIWQDNWGGSYDIYGQRVNAAGAVQWTTGGIPIAAAAGDQDRPRITSDGAGGAIVTWRDSRGGNYDIYAQRINAAGLAQWPFNGVAICTVAGDQQYPTIVSDGASGAIVTWYDERSGNADIYAQRINAMGVVQWAANGVPLCTAGGDQYIPTLVSDGASGAIVAWHDYRGANADIYVQRVNAAGAVQWSANGIVFCAATGNQIYPEIISDGAGGAIVTWQDSRSANADIYVQRVNVSGTIQWTANGVALCTATGNQQYPTVASDGAGGGIVAWFDIRSGNNDIYAHRIDSRGRIGYLAPVIHSIEDVPGDEGGYVNIAWRATPFDYLSGEIATYTIWRALGTPAALALQRSGAAVASNPWEAMGDATGSILRLASLDGETFYWKLVSSIDAYRLEGYSEVGATLFDSTAVCSDLHYFQIIAHTNNPAVYWVSDPDSGYSVDNLAPCPPVCLEGEQTFVPAGLDLRWHRNTEADLDCYHVYRGLSEDFVPSAGNRLGAPCDTLYFDSSWHWGSGYYYKVSAVDVHGNESCFALLRPEDISDAETPKPPEASYLSQNYPNPFNPMTRITFGLATSGRVSLRIYDAAGRLVRALVEGERPAGSYVEPWDGRDGRGADVASGIYFYRLDAGPFTQTRKMILLR